MKRLNLALLLLGLFFLAYLVWRVGPSTLATQVLALGWALVLLVLSDGAGNLAHTLGWRRCFKKSYRGSVSLFALFRMFLAGFSINYLLPTASVGGEASKAALLSATQPVPEAVSTVLLDKLATALGHLALVLAGAVFILLYAELPSQAWLAMAVVTLLLTTGMSLFLILQRKGALGAALRWLVARNLGGAPLARATVHISQVDDVLKRFYRERPFDLAASVAWHIVGHSVIFLQAWLFLKGLAQPAGWLEVGCVGFLSLWFDLLTFAIPLNLGALEGSRMVALKAIGNSASLGLAFGTSLRITQLFWAFLGLASYGWFTTRKASRTLTAPVPPSNHRLRRFG